MTLKNTLSRKRGAVATNETARAEQSIIPALLSERDAAAYTGVSAAYLRRARREGSPGGRTSGPNFVRLESFGAKGGKNGGRVLYARVDLDVWLSGLERKRVI
ncbi:MAG: hypothetical protein LBL05_05380 [Synergistaceae bacterium]|jgi:hypothetical protein|nr:hypothetical protein [Synergistaceae bacterium]